MASPGSLFERPLRVLVVDDVPEIRDIVSMMLEGDRRFRVVGQAADGEEAIAGAEREQPDVVLLDIEMPGMDGWETLPRIRAVAPGASVVIFSGDTSPGARRTAVSRGAAGHLVKGVEARQLAVQLLTIVTGEPTVEYRARPRDVPAAAIREPADAAQRRLEAILDASDEAIISFSLEGRIQHWNRAAERLYGYKAAEAIGQDMSLIWPDDRRQEIQDILDRVTHRRTVENFETTRLRKDGSTIAVSITVSPITDESGAVVAASTLARDLTERHRRDRAFARALAQLERQNQELRTTNEELDRFAYIASHDLAQPLQVMYGYLELLQMEYGDSLDQRAGDWLKMAVSNVERMRQLVRDLLQYARMGASQGARIPVPCDEVVTDALESLAQIRKERDAQVEVSPLPTVEGDRVQLGQLFQNLIGNAIKYTPAATRPVVRIDAEREGEMWRIAVTDNGRGIDPADRERVFEMFERASTDIEGTGLGLAICRRVVEHHGGRLSLEEAPNGGSRFSFTLRPAQ